MYQILKVVGKKVQVRDREQGHSEAQALQGVHRGRVHDMVRDERVGDGGERDDKVRDDEGLGADDAGQDAGDVGHGDDVFQHEVFRHECMDYGRDQHLIHKIWLELGNPHYTNGRIQISLD